MTTPVLTEAEFLKSVENHMMMVVLDIPTHRHLRFTPPNTGIAAFDLITWPTGLCFTGDMGTFVFRVREKDLFAFFRKDSGVPLPEDNALTINPGYWAEKLDGIDKAEGFEEFSPEAFRAIINNRLDEAGASDEVRQAAEELVLSNADMGEREAMATAAEFKHGDFQFVDFLEEDCTDYTYRFIWCCYALVWAIGFYDEGKAAEAAGTPDLPAPGAVQ